MTMMRRLLVLSLLTAACASPALAQAGRFGSAVHVADNEVYVGEPSTTFRPGAVYVYTRAADDWSEAYRLHAPDAERGDGFGSAVARTGDLLFVAADTGIHVFRRDGLVWSHSALITAPSDVPGNMQFGATLAAAGDWLLVGAPGGGRGQQRPAGSVIAFHMTGSDWSEAGRLTTSQSAAADGFGSAIAVADEYAVIGAPGTANGAGAAHVFTIEGDSWRPAAILQPEGSTAGDAFGSTVVLSDGGVLVGAPGAGDGIGAAFAFSRTGEDWSQTARIALGNGEQGDRFGSAIAALDGEVIVGAPMGGNVTTGHAHAFRGGQPAQRISPSESNPRDVFGAGIAAGDEVLAIAATGLHLNAGGVFIYEKDASGSWAERAALTSEPDILEDISGDVVSCGDDGTASVFACSEVELLSVMSPSSMSLAGRGTRLNDVWGWTDPESGREYALVGRVDGTSFVDITDPANPVFVGELPQTPGGPPSSTWRDIKVYRNHAYIVADAAGAHGMQVFDLTRLRDVQGEPVTFEPTAHYTRINSAHNIVINEETGYAYSVGSSGGGETCGGGLHMIDIREPANPQFAGCFSDPQTGRASTGYSHDAQCVVYNGPDERYTGREICLGSNETSLSIADVTDKQNPVAVSRAAYPNPGYTHQGWFDEEQRYFYMNDELDEIAGSADAGTRTIIWDLTRLDDPQLHREFIGTTRASDHNLYVRGNLMYQSNYRAGLRVIDITDPDNPVEVGYFDTAPYLPDEPGFSGTWSNYPFFESGTVIVTSVQEGLFMLRKRDPNVVF